MKDFMISRNKFLDALVLDADNKTDLIQVHHALEKAVVEDTNVPNKIVHCGECRFWDSPPSCEGLAKCVTGESGIRYRSKNDFCSKGMPLPEPPKGVE